MLVHFQGCCSTSANRWLSNSELSECDDIPNFHRHSIGHNVGLFIVQVGYTWGCLGVVDLQKKIQLFLCFFFFFCRENRNAQAKKFY